MTAYEMMLSESQERMLMVLDPEREEVARAIFDKWDLDFAIVGETIAEDRFLIVHGGEVKADLPLKALSGEAPEYDRPWVPTPAPAPLRDALPQDEAADLLLRLAAHPNHCSRAWVWEQYDSQVGAETLRKPGADAAVVRVHGREKALAFTADVTPRYCLANPQQGGRQAVAEAYRNLCATGARPLATTDNLNFGNPEKPEIMGQFVGCIKGIGEACAALDMPIVSGNVSLYNETDGRGILPTPTIGAVGLLDNVEAIIPTAGEDGDVLVLLGETKGHLGRSAVLADLFGIEEGDAPEVDLAAERAAGELVRKLHAARLIRAAHDLADGGLASAAAEMALASGLGARVDAREGLSDLAWFFGEDQGRYLLAAAPMKAEAVIEAAKAAGVPAAAVGALGGASVSLGEGAVSLEALRGAHAGGFAKMMGEA